VFCTSSVDIAKIAIQAGRRPCLPLRQESMLCSDSAMDRQKLGRTVLVLIAAIAALSGAVDEASETYAEAAFKRSLVTFAVVRTLNGVISVAQGTEIALEPGGVGVNLSVGQILDPINDLVERFSGVMLVAASSLGLQNVLLTMTAWWGVTAALVIASALTIATIWSPRMAGNTIAAAVPRILLVMLFVRFAVPLLIIGTNLVSDAFLATEQAAATAALEATRSEIEELNEDPELPPDPDQSFMDRIGSMIDDSLESMDATDRLARLKDSASSASEHIVKLIVIFVLQTIILPLGFVWLLLETLKWIASQLRRS